MKGRGKRIVLEHWDTLCEYLCDEKRCDDIALCGRLALAMRLLSDIRFCERLFFHRLQELDDQDERDRRIMLEGAVIDSDFEACQDEASLGYSIDSDGHWCEQDDDVRWHRLPDD